MATFVADVPTTRAVGETHRIIAGYLGSKGYAEKGERGANEWRKGVYWIKYVTFTVAPGRATIRAWINLPYPGMGSYIKYFMGRNELKSMVAELEKDLRGAGELPPYAAAAGSVGFVAGAETQAQEASHPPLASFGSRAAALLVDIVSVQLLTMPFVLLLFPLVRSGGSRAHSTGDVTGALLLLAFWFYFAKLESSPRQATWGKRLLGIKVCGLRGERISMAKASGRFFGKLLSGILYGIGFLIAVFTKRKQALHDLLSGTLVVSQ